MMIDRRSERAGRLIDGEGGGSMTLEQATINSVNTVYAQLIMQVGPKAVVEAARRMGITTRLAAVSGC